MPSVAFCCLLLPLGGPLWVPAAAEHAVGAVTAGLASHPTCGLQLVVFDVFIRIWT